MGNFVFNGTESFGAFSEALKKMLDGDYSQIIETDNKFVFNVSGFSKEEIEVFYKDDTLEVVCKGSSPYYGDSLVIRKYAPDLARPKITYQNGCVIIESQGKKEKETKLEFDTETLLD